MNCGSSREMVKNNQNYRNSAVQPVAMLNQPAGGRLGNVEQRRQVDLCFRHGDKYVPGHQCKRQLLMLEGDEETQETEETPAAENEIEETGDGEISLHALRGLANSKIIKVEGKAEITG